MSSNKILRIMPFVLGGLILILVVVLIATSGSGKKTDEEENAGLNLAVALTEDKNKKKDNNVSEDNGIKVVDNTDTGIADGEVAEIVPEENEDDTEISIPEPVQEEKGAGNEFGLPFEGKADFIETKSGVNLRAGASTDTDIVAYLAEGKRLERTGYNSEWTRVIYDGVECYIYTPLVVGVYDSIDEPAVQEDTGDNEDAEDNNDTPAGEGEEFGIEFEEKNDYIELKAGINLRVGASTDTAVAAYLENASRVERIGYNADWTKIRYEGKVCYVATFLVVGNVDSLEFPIENNTETGEETAGEAGQDIVVSEDNGENINNDNPVINESAGLWFGAGGKVICIDSGHQNKGNYETEPVGPGSKTMKAKVSSGTCGNYTHYDEYKLNMVVSLALKNELISRGYTVVMTHTTNDVNISNVERAQIANEANVDAFVRIHANSSDNSGVKGMETICQTKSNPYNADIYKQCRKLSDCVLDAMVANTGAKNRGVWETDTMTGINWCEVPVTIIEMGFMSNEEEDRLLSTPEYQEKIVEGIANGIDAFFK